MKKGLLITVGVVLIAAISFTIGSLKAEGANGNWLSSFLENAQTRIDGGAKQKTNELIQQINVGLEGQLENKLNPKVSESEERTKRQLEEHFNQKLSEMDITPQVNEAESGLKLKERNAVNKYKSEIDKAFESVK